MQHLLHARSHMQHLPLTPNTFSLRKKGIASSRIRTRDTSQSLEFHRDALNHYAMDEHVYCVQAEANVCKRDIEI